ncbi:HTH-type transcriptional regulator CynR [Streptomyces himastatinicus ATCC 53653]|uniref:HTH-type transcriptional regulator CynR n=1 Tax=Streptomyces himastatinicus ATCC 53653 TaxID=457427 RepID=D9WQ97_9ACTN|nr:HTH-type transcriptional regulator CynR [Streptomyces himastatinicus ATCC 53653]
MLWLDSIAGAYYRCVQLHQLRYFAAVADTRHFTRAAERLHVAQPSLSQQIKALERELGADLFHRARGHIALTDAGEALLPLARQILADTETARREVQEVAQLRRGRVRLGAPPSLCASLVPDVLRRFHDAFPGIELIIDEGGSQDLVRTLAAGELDLALIITPLPGQAPALAATELLSEELVVASSPAAPPPTKARRIRVEDLRDRPMVMFRRGYDLREFTTAACRAAGFEPSFTVEGGEMDAVLGFVRAGLGIAVLPGMVAARSGLRVTPFAGQTMRRTIAVAHRKDVAPPRAARELRRVLLAYLRSADADDLGTRLLP